jgi:hypothetical protein
MAWPFVGRTEQLDRIRTVFTESRPGPVMLFGPPGMGRSRLLTEALGRAPLAENDVVLRLEPAGQKPFAALRGLLPPGFIHSSSPDNDVTGAADEIAGRLSGRRPVLAFDDAHLADPHSMRVLRHLRGAYGALVLVTAAGTGALPHGPDPLDCLRYDLGTSTLRLPPLSPDDVSRILADALGGPVRSATAAAVHASTGGNPGLLHGMVVRDRLADALVPHDGVHQLAPAVHVPARRGEPASAPPPPSHLAGEPVTGNVTEAVATAWRELVLDQVDELCRLAAWQGLGGLVAPVWAMVLLLRGQVAASRQVLDTHAGTDDSPRVVMTRAMVAGLGQRQVAVADALLVDAAHLDTRHRERLLACRAWLLAVTGTSTAAPDLADPGDDRETALFSRAAQAVAAQAAGRASEAVSHLRRALAVADCLRGELPWFAPYLTACLIDALLLAGRISEATAEAADFHAGRRGCGWSVAVAFDALLAKRQLAPVPEVLG